MKLSEILGKSIDVITGNPAILLPYIVPVIISLIAIWAHITNMINWGITRLYPLGRSPLQFFAYLATALRALRAIDWVIWIFVLITMAICVALTIVMCDARLSGRTMKLGAAFDAVSGKLPIFIIAFLLTWFLKFVGIFFFWVGIFVPSVLLIFVGQAVLLENKDLFDSFSKSYDSAKDNWVEILVLLFIFLVILVVVRPILFLGVIVTCFLSCYSAVTFTVMYRDRSRVVG
jgi:hypothetical protein